MHVINDEATEHTLPRAVSDEPANETPEPVDLPVATSEQATVGGDSEPVTLATLKAALEQRRAELGSLQAEESTIDAELRQAFATPDAFSPERILLLRGRKEEIAAARPLAVMLERQAQYDFYAASLQVEQWRFEGLIARRDSAQAALAEATNLYESTQAAAGACHQAIRDFSLFALRIRAEMDSLKREYAKSLSLVALRAPMPPRENLNESVRRELQSIGHTEVSL